MQKMDPALEDERKLKEDDSKKEPLEIIREEQTISPTHSITHELTDEPKSPKTPQTLTPSPAASNQNEKENIPDLVLTQPQPQPKLEPVKKQITEADVQKLLKEKEEQLTQEFEKRMIKEVTTLIDRFDFILRNEQIRASYMLTEAHRERQEKVRALQTQLECKNLSGLMYVLCNERRRCKVEKLRLIEDYTNYINYLNTLLEESQQIILNLSRGYKTAARVDHEWREKMKLIIEQFQNFVYHFAGGTPEESQYFFDLPKLLTTRASVVDNPKEDPIDCSLHDYEEFGEEMEEQKENAWYERLDDECRPFVMYGDMADFKPDRRRTVLKHVKAAKTAPRKWKEYVFNDMFLKAKCNKADQNKDDILSFYLSTDWECPMIREEATELAAFSQGINADAESIRRSQGGSLKVGAIPESRRHTRASVDVRGMGSILKIITSSVGASQKQTKATLLGARDSLEIASTTALREKLDKKSLDHSKDKVNVINVGTRRTSFYEESKFYEFDKIDVIDGKQRISATTENPLATVTTNESIPGVTELEHVDSLQVIPKHEPDQDHRINDEKVCPIEQCQKRKLNSFMGSLPTYMRLSPFVHFESTYDQYEACSPEQLDMLKKRIEDKKRREKDARPDSYSVNPLDEWTSVVEGVAIQTSEVDLDMEGVGVCTCRDPNVTPASSTERVFDFADLIPIKQKLDAIAKKCFYDDQIEFNRFKVIGEENKTNPIQKADNIKRFHENFTRNRVQEIRTILKKHPSLCDIFQANTKC